MELAEQARRNAHKREIAQPSRNNVASTRQSSPRDRNNVAQSRNNAQQHGDFVVQDLNNVVVNRNATQCDGNIVVPGRNATQSDRNIVVPDRNATQSDANIVVPDRNATQSDGNNVVLNRNATQSDGNNVASDRNRGQFEETPSPTDFDNNSLLPADSNSNNDVSTLIVDSVQSLTGELSSTNPQVQAQAQAPSPFRQMTRAISNTSLGQHNTFNFNLTVNNNTPRATSLPSLRSNKPLTHWQLRNLGPLLDADRAWKHLASKLGVDNCIEIAEQQAKNKGGSPTEEMLLIWMQKGEASMEKLIEALTAMERKDAVDTLQSEDSNTE